MESVVRHRDIADVGPVPMTVIVRLLIKKRQRTEQKSTERPPSWERSSPEQKVPFDSNYVLKVQTFRLAD